MKDLPKPSVTVENMIEETNTLFHMHGWHTGKACGKKSLGDFSCELPENHEKYGRVWHMAPGVLWV